MSALRFVMPRPEKRLTIDELLSELSQDKFDAIEAAARIMREHFTCPPTVPNYDAFKDVLCDFYAHYMKTFYNATIDPRDPVWRDMAYEFAQRNITKYNPSLQVRQARDLHEQERNAITGRNGGMITVIDDFTDAIIKLHINGRIHSVFFDLISPSDYDTQLRLADELLKKYGELFTDEELIPHYIVGMNLEEFVSSFIHMLTPIRRAWRR